MGCSISICTALPLPLGSTLRYTNPTYPNDPSWNPPMLRRRFCLCVFCAAVAAIVYFLMFAGMQSALAQPPKSVSFINDVAPILKENCFACHDAKKKSGKFDMTSFEKFL